MTGKELGFILMKDNGDNTCSMRINMGDGTPTLDMLFPQPFSEFIKGIDVLIASVPDGAFDDVTEHLIMIPNEADGSL